MMRFELHKMEGNRRAKSPMSPKSNQRAIKESGEREIIDSEHVL
jgi:hypothetical protein